MFALTGCEEEITGPRWVDALFPLAAEPDTTPPDQMEWTAIRPYRFAHDVLTARVGQRIPVSGPPCEPRPGLICTPLADDTAKVLTWIRDVALTTCRRNPDPECDTRTQGPGYVWLGDPPPTVPWREAVDSGFVAVTDRAVLEDLAGIVVGCGGVETEPSGGAVLGVRSCVLVVISRGSHGGALDESCLPAIPPDHGYCRPGYVGREPGWGWFESTLKGGAGNPLLTDTVRVRVLP